MAMSSWSTDGAFYSSRSSTVLQLLKEAHAQGFKFKVIVVDSRPLLEGREMLKELVHLGIKTTYIFSNAIPYIIKEATKVILGASSVMTNGDIMGRVGTSIICMAAYDAKVPVLVLCESYKFSDNLVRLDSFVWNELGDPEDLVDTSHHEPSQRNASTFGKPFGYKQGVLKQWRNVDPLILLNLYYDMTPAKFITVVACEHGLIPSTLVASVIHQEQ